MEPPTLGGLTYGKGTAISSPFPMKSVVSKYKGGNKILLNTSFVSFYKFKRNIYYNILYFKRNNCYD